MDKKYTIKEIINLDLVLAEVVPVIDNNELLNKEETSLLFETLLKLDYDLGSESTHLHQYLSFYENLMPKHKEIPNVLDKIDKIEKQKTIVDGILTKMNKFKNTICVKE